MTFNEKVFERKTKRKCVCSSSAAITFLVKKARYSDGIAAAKRIYNTVCCRLFIFGIPKSNRWIKIFFYIFSVLLFCKCLPGPATFLAFIYKHGKDMENITTGKKNFVLLWSVGRPFCLYLLLLVKLGMLLATAATTLIQYHFLLILCVLARRGC